MNGITLCKEYLERLKKNELKCIKIKVDPAPMYPDALGWVIASTGEDRIGSFSWGKEFECGFSDNRKPPYMLNEILFVKEIFFPHETCTLFKESDYESAISVMDSNGNMIPIVWWESEKMDQANARFFIKINDLIVEKDGDNWFWVFDIEQIPWKEGELCKV